MRDFEMDLSLQPRECGRPHDRGKRTKTLKRLIKATSLRYYGIFFVLSGLSLVA